MASHNSKSVIIGHHNNRDEEAKNLEVAGAGGYTNEKRRSSILKQHKSSPKSPRVPLSEFNREEIQERRKSLANKRVSFAETHQITEFLPDYNACSKEFEGSQEINLVQLSMHSQASVQYHITSNAEVINTQYLENQNINGDSKISATRFFTDSSAHMHDTTYIGEEYFAPEEQQSLQHNITDNVPEDMSLTLDILSKPAAEVIQVFNNEKSIIQEPLLRKPEKYDSLNQVSQLLIPEMTDSANISRNLDSFEKMEVELIANKSFFFPNEEVSQLLTSKLGISNDGVIVPEAWPSYIEQAVVNASNKDSHLYNQESYFLDSSLKCHITTEIQKDFSTGGDIFEQKNALFNESEELSHVHGLPEDFQDKMFLTDSNVIQTSEILTLTVCHKIESDEIPEASLSDSKNSGPFLKTINLNESMDLTNPSTQQEHMRIKTTEDLNNYNSYPIELTDVDIKLSTVVSPSATRYSCPMEITNVEKEISTCLVSITEDKEVHLDHLTLSAVYSPKIIPNTNQDILSTTVALLDYANEVMVPESTTSTQITQDYLRKQIEIKEPVVANTESFVAREKHYMLDNQHLNTWNNIFPAPTEELSIIQAQTDCKVTHEIAKTTGARPKVKTSYSTKPRKDSFSFMTKKLVGLSLQPSIFLVPQGKANLKIPKIIDQVPSTVDPGIEIADGLLRETLVIMNKLPMEIQSSSEKPKDCAPSVQSSAFRRIDPFSMLKAQRLLKSPSSIPVILKTPTQSKLSIPRGFVSSNNNTNIPTAATNIMIKSQKSPIEKPKNTIIKTDQQFSNCKPSNVDDSKEQFLVFTTPYFRRSVVVHSCAQSSGKQTRRVGKHISTPLSERSKPATKKLCPINVKPSPPNIVHSKMKPSTKKIPTSEKRSITLISERKKPVSKKTCIDNGNQEIDLYPLNTEISLIDEFSIDINDNRLALSQDNCKTKASKRSPQFISFPKKPLSSSRKNPTIQERSSPLHNEQPHLIHLKDKLVETSQLIPSNVVVMSPFTNPTTKKTCSHHQIKQHPRISPEQHLHVPDIIVNAFIKNNSADSECSSQLNDSDKLVPKLLDCVGSPALSMRKNDIFNTNLHLENTKAKPQANLRRALQDDFQGTIPDTPVYDNRKASSAIFSLDQMMNQNYTFTTPNVEKVLKSCEPSGLKEEVKARMGKATDGLINWTFVINWRNKNIVHFNYLSKLFFLAVEFSDVLNDGGVFRRAITDIQIKTKYRDESSIPNIWVLKIVHYHLKYADPLESFKTSEDLPDLLVNITDAFYRGHCLISDLRLVGSLGNLDIQENEEGFEIKLKVFNYVLATIFSMTFTVKLQSYPFAAIRPTFQSIQGSKTETFRLSAIQTTMMEKTGQNYLWRMWDATRKWLDAQVTQANIDELERLRNYVFEI